MKYILAVFILWIPKLCLGFNSQLAGFLPGLGCGGASPIRTKAAIHNISELVPCTAVEDAESLKRVLFLQKQGNIVCSGTAFNHQEELFLFNLWCLGFHWFNNRLLFGTLGFLRAW